MESLILGLCRGWIEYDFNDRQSSKLPIFIYYQQLSILFKSHKIGL